MHQDDAASLLVASAFVLLGAAPAPAQTAEEKRVDVYVTAQDTGDRLAKKPSVALVPLPQPDEATPTILVDTSKAFQTFEGIGGALTDAAAETFAKLPPERQKEVLTAYYDPAKGIGYSLGRTHIHSCDFSSESYAYTETAGDVDLQEGKLVGDKISFVETFDAMGQSVRIEYTGTVKGDEIAFTRKVGDFATEQIVAHRLKD